MRLLIKLLIAGGAVSAPAFTVTMTALSNALGTVTTNAYINPGSGGAGTDSAITPSITTNRTSASNTGVAPFAVQFNAKSTTAASYTSKPLYELFHAWNFSDTGAGTHDYGTKVGSASRNTAYGHTASHVFETPGTYVVEYTCWNPGTLTYNTSSVTITVTDPDTVFSGADTVCIANGTPPVAGVNGVPSGATCVNTSSWATVAGYMTAGKRVLLKRGDTWTITTSAVVTATSQGIIGAYGTGAKPAVVVNANVSAFYMNGCVDWRIVDLQLSANDGGSDVANNARYGVNANASTFLTLLRVESNSNYEAFYIHDTSDTSLFQCNGHDILPTASGYTSYMPRNPRLSLVGSRFNQGYASHNLRVTGVYDTVISHCELANPGSTRHALTLRGWDTNTQDTCYVIISDCKIMNNAAGGWPLHMGQGNDAVNDSLRDIIVERNYIYSPNTAPPVMSKVASDLYFRNNIVVGYGDFGMGVSYSNTAGAPSPSSTYIYNNTFWKPDLSLRNFWSAVALYADTTGTVIKNNLSYSPGATGDGGSNSPSSFLYTTGITGADYTLSNNSSDSQQINTKPWAVTTPATYSEFVPNSYGVNGGTTVPIYDDFTGAAISGTREIGALQA